VRTFPAVITEPGTGQDAAGRHRGLCHDLSADSAAADCAERSSSAQHVGLKSRSPFLHIRPAVIAVPAMQPGDATTAWSRDPLAGSAGAGRAERSSRAHHVGLKNGRPAAKKGRWHVPHHLVGLSSTSGASRPEEPEAGGNSAAPAGRCAAWRREGGVACVASRGAEPAELGRARKVSDNSMGGQHADRLDLSRQTVCSPATAREVGMRVNWS
jgi:hypothetical protein